MKTILYSNNFESLEAPKVPLRAPSRGTIGEVHDLISKGLVWNGESTPVDNLWETCSKEVERRSTEALRFNVPEIDGALSTGGLSSGALHELQRPLSQRSHNRSYSNTPCSQCNRRLLHLVRERLAPKGLRRSSLLYSLDRATFVANPVLPSSTPPLIVPLYRSPQRQAHPLGDRNGSTISTY